MTDADFKNAIDIISQVIDGAGVLVVVVGLLAAAGAFAIGQARRDQRALAYRAFRQQVGKAILLGLEFWLPRTSSAPSRSRRPFRASVCWPLSSRYAHS